MRKFKFNPDQLSFDLSTDIIDEMTAMKRHLKLPIDMEYGKGNCGLVALAVASKKTLKEATAAYSKYRKVNRTGGTYDEPRKKALADLGVNYTELGTEYPYGYDYKNTKGWKKRTLRKFIEDHTKKDTTYVITTGSHVQTIRNGWVIDQGDLKKIENYRGKNNKVREVLELEAA